MCAPVTQSEIKEIVGKHKNTRASRIDEIPTRLIKNASNLYYKKLTNLVNDKKQRN